MIAAKAHAGLEAAGASKALAVAASAATLVASTVVVGSIEEEAPARGTVKVARAPEALAQPQPRAVTEPVATEPETPTAAPVAPASSVSSAPPVATPAATVPLPAVPAVAAVRAVVPQVSTQAPTPTISASRLPAAPVPPPVPPSTSTPAPVVFPERSIPPRLTIPVELGESAIGADEDERTLDPLTKPVRQEPVEEDSGAGPETGAAPAPQQPVP